MGKCKEGGGGWRMTKELMKIELIKVIPELEHEYRAYVHSFISNGNFTLEEWNSRLKYFRDDVGYSIIHYFEAVVNRLDIFVTFTKKMLENREELEKRFGVKIRTPEEFLKEDAQDNANENHSQQNNGQQKFADRFLYEPVNPSADANDLCECGYAKWEHNKGLSYCKCKKFVKQNKGCGKEVKDGFYCGEYKYLCPKCVKQNLNEVCECGRELFCSKCRKTHLCLTWCDKYRESLDCKKFANPDKNEVKK